MKRYGDLITGVIGMVIGAALMVYAIQIGIKEGQAIGADFLPKICAVIICGLSAKLAFDGWKSSRAYVPQEQEYQKNYSAVLITAAACILYAAMLKPVGFVITSILFLYLTIVLMSKKEETSYVKFAVITVVTVLAIYFVFTKFFGIRLPKGVLNGIL